MTACVTDVGGSSLEIQLLRFSSPKYAESFEMTVLAPPGASAFPAIPGAIAITDFPCCEHEVWPQKDRW